MLTAQDASDALASEDFKPYVLRKYDEYAKRVREIREGGGNAGMLTRREWYEVNKDNLRDAWKNAHGRNAPQDFEPPTPKPRRPRNNRGRRRQATAESTGRSTSRKPTPDDVPEPATGRPVRPARRPRRQPVVGDTPSGAGGGMGGAGGPNANNEGNLKNRSKRESGVLKIGEILGSDFDIDLPYEQKFGVNAPNNFPMARDRRGQVVWNPDVLRAFNLADLKIEELNLRDTHMAIYMQGNVYIVRKTDAKNAENVWRNNSQDGNMLGYRDMNFPIVEPDQAKAPTPTPSSPKSGNTPALKMNNLADNHETAMPKLQPKDGKFVSVPVGNKGINTVDEAKAYKGSLADIPDDFILEALQARTANFADRRGLTPEIRDAVLKVFPNLDDAQISAKLEKLTVDVRRGIGTDVQAGLGALPPQRIQENIALVKALKENGIDFVQMPVGSGITSPQYFLLLDENPQKWGRGYFLKFGDEDYDGAYNDGNSGSQHAEIVGNILAKNLGFANGSPRMAGGDDSGPFLLMDIFLNNADGKLAGSYEPNKITDPQSRLFNGILNAVMDVRDRHAGNGDLFAGNGAVPLDFGRARFERKTASEMVNYFGALHGMDARPWHGYKKRLSGLQGQDKIRETQAIKKELQETIATARKAIADSFDQLDQVDAVFDAVEDTMKTERRENLEYNLAQLGDTRFIDGLMNEITS